MIVLPGDYDGDLTITKPIELWVAGPDETRVWGTQISPYSFGPPSTITGIDAGERVRVVGISLRQPDAREGFQHFAAVLDCAGAVELADIEWHSDQVPQWPSDTKVGFLRVENSAHVVGTRLRYQSNFDDLAIPDATQGFHGARIENSNVWLERCQLVGDAGGLGGDGLLELGLRTRS